MIIEGTNAIITGGASGLGKAVVQHLTAGGATAAIFDVNDEAGSQVAEATGASFHKVNVCDEQQVVQSLDQIADKKGPVRILVNCAGIAPNALTTRREGPHRIDVFRHTIEVNAVGSFVTTSRFAQKLRDVEPIGEETGIVINTSSITAFDGQKGHAAYAASKAAVTGMTRPLALDLAPLLIRAMCIAPGPFDTPMLDDVPNPKGNPLGTQIPHPARIGKPEEFAMLVEHIIRNPMLNGEVIRLDGAMRLAPQ